MQFKKLPRIRVNGITLYFGYAKNLENRITVGDRIYFESIKHLNNFVNSRLPALTFDEQTPST